MKKKVKSVFRKMVTPNTWGRRNYQGESIIKIKNHRLDKFRPNELKSMGFVQRIATKYVTGITKSQNTVKLFDQHTPNKNISILDAGCGSGLVGLELQKYGYTEPYLYQLLERAELLNVLIDKGRGI